ncbi:hypothetical protein DNL40_12930 [Xylanimonas oleitrophica]|uniref:DUF3592 domain-containing protein n=1 Tax=Xylanimonas oleitrophica TaxID=2607479 RepID=A0A2W5WKJ3_9MICO|nr:DUF3592 domain-containing protein [Xylanimonas oleitrophica]PZR52119.1 hypothetical protein DNL40_12930 [Xylanimonas oleitrophica]
MTLVVVPWVLGVGFTVVGGLLAVTGARMAARRRRHAEMRAARGVQVTGSVVDVSWRRGGENRIGFPVVEFTDSRGRARRFRSDVGTSVPPLEGKEVTVWYDPFDDDAAPVVTGDWREGLQHWVLTVVGAVFALVGVAVLLFTIASLSEG